MRYLFTHAHLIVDDHKEYLDGALLVDEDRIIDVFDQTNKLDSFFDVKIIDLKGSVVMPGFFDTHNHGIKGIDYNVASIDELDEASLYLAKMGTTSYFMTLYGNIDTIKKQLINTNGFSSSHSRYMGIHLEGPFLNDKHLGMANKENFLKPDVELVDELISANNNLKQMTIAVELDGAKDVIKALKQHNIKVMVGHSDALQEDLDENIDGITHLFNAMRGLHHRDLTLANASFSNNYHIELICDGHHIDKTMLKLVLNNIDKNKIMIISDSSIALGLEDGEYEFIGKKCIKQSTTFKTLDGHFAGSVACINDEMKVLKELGASYTDLLKYSGLNAYRFYGLDKQYGTLLKGKYADIVIMDDDLNIKNVYVRGKFLYD